jgi:hypothetical protein
VQALNSPIELPNVESEYQPEPGSLAGFFLSLSDKVDELLAAANWEPKMESRLVK